MSKQITPKGTKFLFVEAQGSDFEIGKQIGSATAEDIADMWEDFILPRMVKFYGTPAAKYGKTYEWLRKNLENVCPWMVEQINGIASGSGVDIEKVWMMNHYALLWPAHGLFCTSMSVRDSDAGPVLIQNLDIGDEDFCYICKIKPNNGNTTLSDAMCSMCWSPTGINDKGLAVGSSNLSSVARKPKKPLKGGITNNFLPRMVLRQCSTTKEAIKFLKSLPDVCPETSGYQLNIIDKRGDMAVVDKTGPHILVRQCEEGMNFTTNFSLDPDLEGWRTAGAGKEQLVKESNFYDRADKIKHEYKQLGGKKPTIKWLKDLFKSHYGKGRICRHGLDCQGGFSRLHFVYYPCEKRVEITNGPPCENEYQYFQL